MEYNQIYHGKIVCYQRQQAVVRGIGTYSPRLRSVFDWVVGRNTTTTTATIEFPNGEEKQVRIAELKENAHD